MFLIPCLRLFALNRDLENSFFFFKKKKKENPFFCYFFNCKSFLLGLDAKEQVCSPPHELSGGCPAGNWAKINDTYHIFFLAFGSHDPDTSAAPSPLQPAWRSRKTEHPLFSAGTRLSVLPLPSPGNPLEPHPTFRGAGWGGAGLQGKTQMTF